MEYISIFMYGLSTKTQEVKLTTKGFEHMKIGRKNKAVLIVTLITGLSAFGAGTYGINKHRGLESKTEETYTINSEVMQSDNKQIEESIIALEEFAKLEKEKELQAAAEQQRLVATQLQEIKDKQVLSRGGSGVTNAQPKNKPTTNTQAKVQPSSSAKALATTTASKTVQATDERDLFYRLVSAEAAGETFEGQLAVATVIMNRVKSPDYANTITGVIMDKSWGYQFTPVVDGRINEQPTASAKKAVDMVLNGYRSFGPEVLFFLNPKKSESPWIVNNKTYYKTIGNHDYYR
jgi:spore germination cell wall hydrolase CwlJ-like protein